MSVQSRLHTKKSQHCASKPTTAVLSSSRCSSTTHCEISTLRSKSTLRSNRDARSDVACRIASREVKHDGKAKQEFETGVLTRRRVETSWRAQGGWGGGQRKHGNSFFQRIVLVASMTSVTHYRARVRLPHRSLNATLSFGPRSPAEFLLQHASPFRTRVWCQMRQ